MYDARSAENDIKEGTCRSNYKFYIKCLSVFLTKLQLVGLAISNSKKSVEMARTAAHNDTLAYYVADFFELLTLTFEIGKLDNINFVFIYFIVYAVFVLTLLLMLIAIMAGGYTGLPFYVVSGGW